MYMTVCGMFSMNLIGNTCSKVVRSKHVRIKAKIKRRNLVRCNIYTVIFNALVADSSLTSFTGNRAPRPFTS